MNQIPPLQDTPSPATLWLEADHREPVLVRLPRGNAVVLSRPNPFHERPNQDAAAVLPAGPDASLLVIADGMGGSRNGGMAAGTLVRHLSRQLPVDSPDLLVRTAVINGIESANRHLVEEGPETGTTLAAVEISEHTMRPYHVGDSVILVVGQRGKLKLQTVSHSPVGLAVEAGLLDEDEALHHHQRHLILNAVGFAEMRIELGAPLPLARHDTVLLASDGLTDNLTLDEIVAGIRKGPLCEAVAALTSLARQRMLAEQPGYPCKPDDLTILAYRRSA